MRVPVLFVNVWPGRRPVRLLPACRCRYFAQDCYASPQGDEDAFSATQVPLSQAPTSEAQASGGCLKYPHAWKHPHAWKQALQTPGACSGLLQAQQLSMHHFCMDSTV